MKPHKCTCNPGHPCYKECEVNAFWQMKWILLGMVVVILGLWFYLAMIY